jgi:hypothetical protein
LSSSSPTSACSPSESFSCCERSDNNMRNPDRPGSRAASPAADRREHRRLYRRRGDARRRRITTVTAITVTSLSVSSFCVMFAR